MPSPATEKLLDLFAQTAGEDARRDEIRKAAGDVSFIAWVNELLGEYEADNIRPTRIRVSTATARFLSRASQADMGEVVKFDPERTGFIATLWGVHVYHDPDARGIQVETD